MIDRRFYVYVLFDQNGLPFYVGKGRGNRWLAHDRAKDPNNRYKNFIVRQTIKALGEVPKVKIRDGLSEPESFDIESAFIKAIGRYPHGPLVNQTDNRNGPSSETITAWHASRTKEQRKASARKSQETMKKKYTKEELSRRARCNALSIGEEAMLARLRDMRGRVSPQKRLEYTRKAGVASQAARRVRAFEGQQSLPLEPPIAVPQHYQSLHPDPDDLESPMPHD